MSDFAGLSDWIFDHMQRLFFPEDWIALDSEFSKTEIVTMFFVDRRGETTMSRLAEYLGVPMSTATGIVDRLVKNGSIVRDRSEADRRIVTLRLTDRGKTALETVKNTVSEYIDAIGSALSEEEQRFLVEIALKVVTVLNRMREAGNQNAPRERPRAIEIE